MRKRYILIVKLSREEEIHVGSLKNIHFRRGYYAYIGSGGLNTLKRLKRHFKRDKKVKWHIDYLTVRHPPCKAFIVTDEHIDEVYLSKLLEEKYTYIPNFGSTDTGDKSHLFYINIKENSLHKLREFLENKSLSLLEYIV